MPSPNSSPVAVTGTLEPRLSRGLWLIKWLLVVPHAVILFFLWIAAAVLTVVAWFAILVTGRYPRSIFDFNLGVLRWSWRVWFYTYGALGTDRYPPFTLGPAPDYPATLHIDYPERLSRGLVLVKSWLLAIPHYLVLGFFLGAGVATDQSRGQPSWPWSVGLVGLLVLIAAVVLLFTGAYPRPVFDLVLGMDRWTMRVAAYVLLMTDAYPPFRLDQGGGEPVSPTPGPVDAGDAGLVEVGSTRPQGRRWTTLRIVSLAAGSVLLAGALASGLGGAALLFADKALRDQDGFLMTGGERFTTSSYAVTTGDMRLGGDGVVHRFIGDVKLKVRGSDVPVFIGIARTDSVDGYLAGVAHAVVTDVRNGTPLYREVGGGAPAAAPGGATAWAAQATGEGPQTMRWDATDGHWTVVLMNADGSAGVTAVVSAGATLPVLGWGAVTLLVSAGLLAIVGLVLVLVALPPAPRPAPAGSGSAPTPPGLSDAVR
ncbi:hypothetical protein GCM10009798_39790 [Nocardioides panacihumi]|uniref:DUF4389 domain-containing protein n=1 Tax=Nocardioides panacihumi TaxID=400774 RepID=A0ABN2RTM0_9ACTN